MLAEEFKHMADDLGVNLVLSTGGTGFSVQVKGTDIDVHFDEKQGQRINKNRENLINFLGKMADLISNKLKAQINKHLNAVLLKT